MNRSRHVKYVTLNIGGICVGDIYCIISRWEKSVATHAFVTTFQDNGKMMTKTTILQFPSQRSKIGNSEEIKERKNISHRKTELGEGKMRVSTSRENRKDKITLKDGIPSGIY